MIARLVCLVRGHDWTIYGPIFCRRCPVVFDRVKHCARPGATR